MTALVRSELLKVRTVRSWWAYLIVIVLLVGAAVAGDTGTADDVDRSLLEWQLGIVEAAGLASILALILGITMVTAEFRHGTITPTLLAAPSRERVLASKTIAGTLLAALFGVVALVVVAAVALPWLSVVEADVHLGGELAKRAAATLFGVVLFGLIGIAIGSAVHSQVAALVGTLLWIFLGETLIWGLFSWLDWDGAVSYLPFRALEGADGVGGDDLLRYWPAVGVSLLWIAAIGAAGVVRTHRRDIT